MGLGACHLTVAQRVLTVWSFPTTDSKQKSKKQTGSCDLKPQRKRLAGVAVVTLGLAGTLAFAGAEHVEWDATVMDFTDCAGEFIVDNFRYTYHCVSKP